jgi:MFS family permease
MRWRMLGVLFAARLAMSFQFQAVAALSGAYTDGYGIGLDSIGLLIGLYLSPGLLIAFPSGVIGAFLGGKRGVGLGLLLMTAGALLALSATSWNAEIMARLLAGTGGVLLNVLMTKMVTDWFAQKDIATAMGLYVNSWPVGIALALVSLPGLHKLWGVFWADVLVLAVCGSALIAFMAMYQNPPDLVENKSGPVFGRPGGASPVIGITLAGLIWGLMNAGLALGFSFGTPLLVGFGVGETAAAGQTSLLVWTLAFSAPFGGIIADRTGRYDFVIALAIIGFGAAMALAATGEMSLLAFVLAGVCAGLSAGPIMSLAAGVLPAHWRSQGMGLFFTVYYATMMIAPPLAGLAAERTGMLSATFWIAVAMIWLCLPVLVLLPRYRLASV